MKMADKSEEWDKQERFNEIESMDDIVEIHLIKDGFVKIFRDGEKLTEIQKKYAIVTEYTRKFK